MQNEKGEREERMCDEKVEKELDKSLKKSLSHNEIE
jgi:hypothetical protein